MKEFYAVGEILEHKGRLYKVAEDNPELEPCEPCIFKLTHCPDTECLADDRKDHKDVCFVEVED